MIQTTPKNPQRGRRWLHERPGRFGEDRKEKGGGAALQVEIKCSMDTCRRDPKTTHGCFQISWQSQESKAWRRTHGGHAGKTTLTHTVSSMVTGISIHLCLKCSCIPKQGRGSQFRARRTFPISQQANQRHAVWTPIRGCIGCELWLTSRREKSPKIDWPFSMENISCRRGGGVPAYLPPMFRRTKQAMSAMRTSSAAAHTVPMIQLWVEKPLCWLSTPGEGKKNQKEQSTVSLPCAWTL